MYIIVMVTVPNEKEGNIIARALIDKKLAACVNIVAKVHSLFWWDKKIDKSRECLLIIKSKKAKFSRLLKKVKSLHSYETPEIIALPIISGDKSYLRWIDESIR